MRAAPPAFGRGPGGTPPLGILLGNSYVPAGRTSSGLSLRLFQGAGAAPVPVAALTRRSRYDRDACAGRRARTPACTRQGRPEVWTVAAVPAAGGVQGLVVQDAGNRPSRHRWPGAACAPPEFRPGLAPGRTAGPGH